MRGQAEYRICLVAEGLGTAHWVQKCVGASSKLSYQVTLGVGGTIPRLVDIAEPINMNTYIILTIMEGLRANLQDSSLLAQRRHKNSQNNDLPARRYATNLPRPVTDSLSSIGLSTRTTQIVKTVNVIYHLFNKDWGKQAIKTIAR